MIKKILIGFGILLVLIVAYGSYFFFYATRQHSPQETIRISNGTESLIEITYCKPSVKGRVIFGDESEGALQPFGKYWRMGANQATSFTNSKPVTILGNKLDPGTHAIYAYPGKDEWEIVFHPDYKTWGAMERDSKDELFRVTVPAMVESDIEEMFKMSFKKQDNLDVLNLRWEYYNVDLPMIILE